VLSGTEIGWNCFNALKKVPVDRCAWQPSDGGAIVLKGTAIIITIIFNYHMVINTSIIYHWHYHLIIIIIRNTKKYKCQQQKIRPCVCAECISTAVCGRVSTQHSSTYRDVENADSKHKGHHRTTTTVACQWQLAVSWRCILFTIHLSYI